MNFKNTLRKEIDKKLSSLRSKDRENLSYKITQNILKSEPWLNSSSIFIYINFKNEVETQLIIDLAIAYDKIIYAPRIDNKTMNFYRIDNINKSDLVKNSYGILEPPLNEKPQTPEEDSLILVPGVSFSTCGKRLGRGAGYYDKYLTKNNNGIKMGLTFAIQIDNNVPTEEWDVTMDYVITEESIYKTGVKSGN